MSNKKIIGVCTTKVNSELCRSFLSVFHEKAREKGFSTLIFHSIYDFCDLETASGAEHIFKMLPYDKLCALIIMRDCIYNEDVLEAILNDAVQSGIPVIMVRGTDKRCASIVGDYEPAYEKLLKSVIEKQNVKDTFFLAGRRNSDPDSENRLAIYRKVLEECGIEYDENRIDYGDYRDIPAEEAAKRLVSDGKKPPRAVFCANDIMAFSVMRVLRREGYRIPEDVIVTGFDGLEHSVYCIPSLSTCREDLDALASYAAETAEKLINGEEVPPVRKYPYNAVISESSEAGVSENIERREIGIFNRMRIDEEDEASANLWIDTVMVDPCLNNLRNRLRGVVGGGRSVSIRTDAFFNDRGVKAVPENYLIRRGEGSAILRSSGNIIQELIKDISPEKAVYISMISKDDYIYGIACSETADIAGESGKMNRFVQTLNRALLSAISGENLLKRATEEYGTKYIDALTGLKNNDGAIKWYEEQAAGDASNICQLTIGVYTLINYQYILDNFGTDTIEDYIQYLGQSLKLANPAGTVVARISPESFAVMTVHETFYYAETVDNVISLFYGFLDIKNKKTDKEGMDVSCGYTDVFPPWKGKFGDYINAAVSALYKNRLLFNKSVPKGHDIKDGAGALKMQTKLLKLLGENRFIYHFQPIVSAVTGEIIAYEALMRTDAEIGMSPLDVLSAAGMYSKLNNVELAVFNNVLRVLSENREKFGDRKVFINTIPGYFLTEEQCDVVAGAYKELLSDIVIEITESETISSEELAAIRTFGGHAEDIRIAVDDYGTGHSNIVNLIEYKPQIVKVDRYLVTNIQNDKMKQMFVKNLIEFANENDIKVLAEGVETKEEMETVIDFGVELIQGYYTGKPSPEIISEIDPEIKRHITEMAKERGAK